MVSEPEDWRFGSLKLVCLYLMTILHAVRCRSLHLFSCFHFRFGLSKFIAFYFLPRMVIPLSGRSSIHFPFWELVWFGALVGIMEENWLLVCHNMLGG
jgi:hypothetical protein